MLRGNCTKKNSISIGTLKEVRPTPGFASSARSFSVKQGVPFMLANIPLHRSDHAVVRVFLLRDFVGRDWGPGSRSPDYRDAIECGTNGMSCYGSFWAEGNWIALCGDLWGLVVVFYLWGLALKIIWIQDR